MAAREASDLAHQMLAYSGKGKFVVSPVDLRQVVTEILPLVESQIVLLGGFAGIAAPFGGTMLCFERCRGPTEDS